MGFFGGAAASLWLYPPLAPGRFDFEATAKGADLSRHHAARVVLMDHRGLKAVQTCVGACDDLLLRARLGDAGPTLSVVAADGRELAAGGTYVPGGYSFTTLTVEGGERLRIETTGHLGPR